VELANALARNPNAVRNKVKLKSALDAGFYKVLRLARENVARFFTVTFERKFYAQAENTASAVFLARAVSA
jgi:hypothetical protein